MKTEEEKSKNPAEVPQENSGLKKKNDRTDDKRYFQDGKIVKTW